VFAALERGFLPADTLLKGGCGGWVDVGRFVVTWRWMTSGSVC
jgi:hypothetical protein